MNIRGENFLYTDENKTLEIKKKLDNGVFLDVFLNFQQEKFLEFQKNLIQDFIGNMNEIIISCDADLEKTRASFELKLQDLNEQLSTFAEKIDGVERFTIKGYIQIISLGTLITSLVGDTSLMIFRKGRLYYELYNSVYTDNKIDLFSDFIEGELEENDELVYIGNDFKDLVDIDLIYEMQKKIGQDTSIGTLKLINQIFESQEKQDEIKFLSGYSIEKTTQKVHTQKNNTKIRIGGEKIDNFLSKVKSGVSINKYYITVLFLVIVVLFMMYSVLSQLLESKNIDKFLTADGQEVVLTIDDLKNEIYEFKMMNPKSNQKSEKYSEIKKKIELLESKGKWLNDINNLKKILEKDYYNGFNIILVNDMSSFNDIAMGTNAKLLNFNTSEIEKLGNIKTINYNKGIYIGGEKGALIKAINDGSRGSLIQYLIESPMQSCDINLLKDGLYCYSNSSELFNITKEGIVPISLTEGEFPETIGGIATYGNQNFYIFQPSMNSSKPGTFTTKYRNEPGSQISFMKPMDYPLLKIGTGSVKKFDENFISYAIDGNFLTWSKKKLYQLWRPGQWKPELDVREIPMMGGDKLNSFSNNVKIISNYGSPYIYLYDKDKSSFFVYSSEPSKTQEKSEKTYGLVYLLSFKFQLGEEEKVIDVTLNPLTKKNPEAYVLTNKGVYKINLYSYIDSFASTQQE